MSTNKSIVAAAYDSFAKGDVPAVLAVMDEHIEWTEAEGSPMPGTFVGPRAVVDGVFLRLGEIGDAFSVVPEQLVAEDDTVVALGRYTWRHLSTKEPAEVKMVHVWTLRDGKVIAFQQHVDTLKLQERSN